MMRNGNHVCFIRVRIYKQQRIWVCPQALTVHLQEMQDLSPINQYIDAR
jgi:hypothetical protein